MEVDSEAVGVERTNSYLPGADRVEFEAVWITQPRKEACGHWPLECNRYCDDCAGLRDVAFGSLYGMDGVGH